MSRPRICLIPILICVNAQIRVVAGEAPGEGEVRKLFEERYRAWRAFMDSDARVLLSDTEGYSTRQYKAIIALGVRALPYIIEKMRDDPGMWYAVRIISKRVFTVEERKKTGGDWVPLFFEWRERGRFKAEQRFEELYTERRRLMREANQKYERIKQLGILALPYVMRKMIDECDEELVELASYLTGQNFPDRGRIKDCIDWWDRNKWRWVVEEALVDGAPRDHIERPPSEGYL